MVCTLFRGFCSSRPMAVVHGSWAIDRVWRRVGELTVTLGFRRTMESFSRATFSSRLRRDETSITWSSGSGTNSDASNEKDLEREKMSDLSPVPAPVGILLAMTAVTGIVDAV